MLYYVDRVRDGRSYATRSVRAVQTGKAVFVMMCSFQLPEHQQPARYWPMPKVSPPEDCPDEVELIRRMAEEQPDRTEEARAWLRGYAKVSSFMPVVIANLCRPLTCVVAFIRHEKIAQLPLSTRAKL